jgi:DNA-binding NarL/FixJ family response regulator
VIRVAIVATSSILGAGLESLIRGQSDFEIAGSFSDPDAAAANADVLVVAATAEALDRVLGDSHAPPVVWMSDEASASAIAEALELGVAAVLPLDCTPAELIATVEGAAAGLVIVRRQDLSGLLGSSGGRARESVPDAGDNALSPRELEVLRMIAQGLPNKTIAWKLGISEHTVKFHVASILDRLNASSRTDAVAIGIRRGLILL